MITNYTLSGWYLFFIFYVVGDTVTTKLGWEIDKVNEGNKLSAEIIGFGSFKLFTLVKATIVLASFTVIIAAPKYLITWWGYSILSYQLSMIVIPYMFALISLAIVVNNIKIIYKN